MHAEKLHEWYCNRDSRNMSVHHTRFAVKDLMRVKVRWRTRLDHEAEPGVPVRNGTGWSSGRHLCPRKVRQVGWKRKGVIKLFCGEGFGEEHRSAVVGEHVECRDQDGGARQSAVRYDVEGQQVQGGECVRSGRKEFDDVLA